MPLPPLLVSISLAHFHLRAFSVAASPNAAHRAPASGNAAPTTGPDVTASHAGRDKEGQKLLKIPSSSLPDPGI